MAWITGTATDHRDMLDQAIQIATSDHVDTAVVVAGGTGYSVDDIIEFTDGTFTHPCRLRVTSETGGVIDPGGVRVEEGGAYTVDPDLTANPNHTVTPAGGSGATFDLTMNSEPWTVERRAQEAVSAVLFGAGGSGYAIGDQVRVSMNGGGVLGASGESFYGVAPVFQVATLSGSAIATVTLVTPGHLEEVPDVDLSAGFQCDLETVTGSGSGAQLTVTYQDVGSSQEDVVILSGPGEAGTDQILVGIRTFSIQDVSGFETVRNWQLFGLTDFNAGLALHEQNNMSYGADENDGAIETLGGSFMVLKENDADPDISFWMSVTNRRIILVAKVETNTTIFYPSMYVGFLNAFSTTNEEPYPLWIQGCTSRENSWWGDTELGRISGLSDCYSVTAKTNGPAQYRADEGEWRTFRNGQVSDTGAPSRSATSDFTVFPAGLPSFSPQTDDLIATQNVTMFDLSDIIPESGVPGTPDYLLRPTPNTGDDIRLLVPLSPKSSDNPTNPARFVYDPIGELDNCFWISASDPTQDLTSEDVVKIGNDRYRVFQNGNSGEVFRFIAIKEE